MSGIGAIAPLNIFMISSLVATMFSWFLTSGSFVR